MLNLVEYDLPHLPKLIEYLNDEEVTKWLCNIPNPYTQEHANKWLAFCRECKLSGTCFPRAIEVDKLMIGHIELKLIFKHSAEIGYWLGKSYWNQGYATNAVKQMLSFAFNNLELKRIQAYVLDGNNASIRVLEKCGFKFEGYLRKSHTQGDKYVNSSLYAIVI
jgi:ribosomal-protein-alanine N-acetyltransferase